MGSDKLAKEMCIRHLEGKEYTNLNIVKQGCDIEGEKDGEKYFFEVKSSTKNKKEPFRGTVMLTELEKAISDKEHYRFIICKGKGNSIDKYSFEFFDVDEFIDLCVLTTPITKYDYDPKKEITRREGTRSIDEELIKNMCKSFNEWKTKHNITETQDEDDWRN